MDMGDGNSFQIPMYAGCRCIRPLHPDIFHPQQSSFIVEETNDTRHHAVVSGCNRLMDSVLEDCKPPHGSKVLPERLSVGHPSTFRKSLTHRTASRQAGIVVNLKMATIFTKNTDICAISSWSCSSQYNVKLLPVPPEGVYLSRYLR